MKKDQDLHKEEMVWKSCCREGCMAVGLNFDCPIRSCGNILKNSMLGHTPDQIIRISQFCPRNQYFLELPRLRIIVVTDYSNHFDSCQQFEAGRSYHSLLEHTRLYATITVSLRLKFSMFIRRCRNKLRLC